MPQKQITEEEFKTAFEQCKHIGKLAVKLGIPHISAWRLAHRFGLKFEKTGSGKIIPLDEILAGQHPYYQTLKLKNRLVSAGIKKNVCEICGISDWNGKALQMQLDHKDGISHNHVLDNLQMVCPNCHSQTETFCGRNKRIPS